MIIKVVMMVMILLSKYSNSAGAAGVLWVNHEREQVTLPLETVMYECSLHRYRHGLDSN